MYQINFEVAWLLSMDLRTKNGRLWISKWTNKFYSRIYFFVFCCNKKRCDSNFLNNLLSNRCFASIKISIQKSNCRIECFSDHWNIFEHCQCCIENFQTFRTYHSVFQIYHGASPPKWLSIWAKYQHFSKHQFQSFDVWPPGNANKRNCVLRMGHIYGSHSFSGFFYHPIKEILTWYSITDTTTKVYNQGIQISFHTESYLLYPRF